LQASEEKARREREREERKRAIELEREERKRAIEVQASKLRDDERLRLARTLIPNIEELRRLSWQQFEDQVASMFERMGYTVEQTPYVKDHGRDAILSKNGGKFLLECKRYAEGAVSGRRDLQILHSNMITDRAVSGFFITAGNFTKDAIEFARANHIQAVDGPQLLRLMFESKPASGDDSYRTMCGECGLVVLHRLRLPRMERCSRGHDVAPTLDPSAVLTASGAAPICDQCGAPMRLVHWKRRKFWGCTRYPKCRHTRRWRHYRADKFGTS
jgi:HJR/Mrr/RecB family endonuclease